MPVAAFANIRLKNVLRCRRWVGSQAKTHPDDPKTFDNTGTSNDYTLFYIDNDSDAASEAIIKLGVLVTLTAYDFYL